MATKKTSWRVTIKQPLSHFEKDKKGHAVEVMDEEIVHISTQEHQPDAIAEAKKLYGVPSVWRCDKIED